MTDPVDCAYVVARVHRLLDGELGEREADLLRHHIDACEHCLDEADLLALLKAVVRRSCACAAPETLRLRIVSQITYTRVQFDPGL